MAGWQKAGKRRWRQMIVGALLLYVVGTLVQIGTEARTDTVAPADAIVVLGAAQWNGRPSPVLRARLDHAIALYQQGYAPWLITTGGYGRDPRWSEAGVGADYAVARGVPHDAILMEEGGTSTLSSLQAVAALAEGRAIRRIIVVSDPFHIARSRVIARQLGFEALGSPTQTSPISRNPLAESWYMLQEVVSFTVLRVRLLKGLA